MIRALSVFLSIIILMMPATSFAGGCADVDNSGAINILDITYLISYLYKDGPGPLCGESTGTVTDIDGNVYQTVKIGDQWWMAENLKVTHYRNGDEIPNVTSNGGWSIISSGAYCNYNNDVGHVATYGRLYNWYAVDDSRGIAPQGWHVPSDAEWKQLEMYLGMSQAEADATGWRGTNEGGKLKEAGTEHWWSPNTGATNQSGFTALPGGDRTHVGIYENLGISGFFWTTTEYYDVASLSRFLDYQLSEVGRNSKYNNYGLSIRCVKD